LNGRIYSTDYGNHRVQVFNSDGKFLFKFGSKGNGDSQFNYPCGIFVDKRGRIIVVDSDNHRIQVFNSRGEFLFKFGSYGKEDGQFKYPHGVVVD